MPARNLLKTTPPGAVRSLDELFAIAAAMEHEAFTRYTQLAEQMRSEGQLQLAEMFDRLAADEDGHEASVTNWARHQSGKAPDPTAIRWDVPETFDSEMAEELASSRLIDTYRVLSMAVRNEERAFTLWAYIAAQAEKPEIQQAAERMAHEELGHISALRRARREAYHAGRATRPREGATSVGALLALAARLEARLAEQLTGLHQRLGGADAARAQELALQTRAMADEVAAMALDAEQSPPAAAGDEDAATLAERLVEAYLDIGDRSRDEAVVARTQDLARQAIARLAWLRLLRDFAFTG
jgi:rubrerythrin